jgi:hypothetical protein
MANQIKQHSITNKLDALSETEYSDVLNYISHLEASRADKTNISDDDLIIALQNQRENCRARQVFEWEHVRRESPNSSSAFLRGTA